MCGSFVLSMALYLFILYAGITASDCLYQVNHPKFGGRSSTFKSCGPIPSPPSFYHRTFLGSFARASSFSSCWNPNNLPKTPPGFGTGHSRASLSNILASSWNWRNNAASSPEDESFLSLVGATALSPLPAATVVIRVGCVGSRSEAPGSSAGCSCCSSLFLRFRRTAGRLSESSCRSASA
jgi:hypothetical protein